MWHGICSLLAHGCAVLQAILSIFLHEHIAKKDFWALHYVRKEKKKDMVGKLEIYFESERGGKNLSMKALLDNLFQLVMLFIIGSWQIRVHVWFVERRIPGSTPLLTVTWQEASGLSCRGRLARWS
jgi:hypothetical protein